MPPRSNKTIWAMYAAVFGGFVYLLWTIAVGRGSSGSAVSATVATDVNNVIVGRRNNLIEESRLTALRKQTELQQAAFRAQAAAKSQQTAPQTTPAPVYTPPAQTYIPPTPTYVRPRTTIS